MYTNTTTSRSTNQTHSSNHSNHNHQYHYINTSQRSCISKDKESSLLLLQFCRSGQYELIKQYLTDDVSNQYATKKKKNGMNTVDDNCLQYVIRSTCYYNSTKNSCNITNSNENDDNVLPNQDQMILLDVIQLLLEYNPNQLYIIHPLTGTILHEAIQYKCSNNVIYFLLQYSMNRCMDRNHRSISSGDMTTTNTTGTTEHDDRQEENDNDNLMDYDYYYYDDDDSDPLHATTTTEISSSSSVSSSSTLPYSYSTTTVPPIMNLFSIQDDIGRTVLHCMVSRWQRSYHRCYYYSNHNSSFSNRSQGSYQTSLSSVSTSSSTNHHHHHQNDITTLELFDSIIKVYSQQVLIHDVDGYTPLLQLLQTPILPISSASSSTTTSTMTTSTMTIMEQEIYTIVQYMIQYQPNVVMIAKQIPYYNSSSLKSSLKSKSPNHASKFHATTTMTMVTNDDDHHNHSNPTKSCNKTGVHTPLFYALLYGRSIQTIQLLIDTYRQQLQPVPDTHIHHNTNNNNNTEISCVPYSALQLSQYKEIALHIVITTMLSTNILQCIVQDYMIGTLCRDMYTLTPIDWIWFVYVREYSNLVLQQQQEQHEPIINHNHHIPDHHQHQQQQQQHTATRLRQLIARRRHLPDHTLVWHNYISERIVYKLQQYNNNNYIGETIHHCIDPNDNDNNDNIGTSDLENTESILLLNREHLSLLSNELEYIENDFIHRISILLPAAAACKWDNELKYGYNYSNFISAPTSSASIENPFHTDIGNDSKCNNMYVLLNAACYVPCPLVVIQLILLRLYDQQQNYQHQVQMYHPLQYRDPHTLRFPLHYAASRVSYHATLPIGYITSSFTTISTTTNNTTTPNGLHMYHDSATPIHVIGPLYPDACCYCDIFGQLPLHIAIDTYKNHRLNLHQVQTQNNGNNQKNHNSNTFDQQIQLYNHEEDRVLQLLIQLYPSSIHIRDGKTKLYPFQQAAVHVDDVDGVVSVPTFTRNTAITVINDDHPMHGSNGNCDNNECRLTTIYQLLRLNPSLITK